MRVLLTGATGYIGSAVAERLKFAGHEVIGLARSEEKARQIEALGYEALTGNLRDRESLMRAASGIDRIIHAAKENAPDSGDIDRAAVEALVSTGRPLLYTSGVWVIGSTFGRTVGELTPLSPPALVAWRPAVERLVLDSGGVVLRPGMAYGRGGSTLGALMRQAHRDGVLRLVGKGDNHWSWVHIDDLADLYVLAMERMPKGEMFLAVDGPPVQVKDLAAAIARAVGARIEYVSLEQARTIMGPVADALALDQKVASTKAARLLGWTAGSPTVLQAIESGVY